MKDHKPSCPRLLFWDAGEYDAPCTCGERRMKDPKRVKAGRSSRIKGKRVELEAAKLLDKLYPEYGPWKRTSRGVNQDNGDLVPAQTFPVIVEVKSRKTLTIGELKGWWDSLVKKHGDDIREYGLLLLIKVNRLPWLAIAPYEYADTLAKHGVISVCLD